MCNHSRQIGDNYGLSCQECGEQLAGYGYGGFFGRNIHPGVKCKHQFFSSGDGPKVCLYCEAVDTSNILTDSDWQSEKMAEHADWLDEQNTRESERPQ